MKVIKECTCGNNSFTADDIIRLIKINIRPWYNEDTNDIYGYLFECDKCGTSLMASIKIIKIDPLDLI